MRLVSLLSMVACLGSGCSMLDRAAPGPGTVPVCKLAGIEARPCAVRGQTNVCHIHVGRIGSETYVYPSTLKIDTDKANTVIVWRLQEVLGAHFVRGEGPIWKDSSSAIEFEEGGPTDDADGKHEDKEKAKGYRIKFKNRNIGRGPHKYTVQYRTEDGKLHKCDPVIVSQGG